MLEDSITQAFVTEPAPNSHQVLTEQVSPDEVGGVLTLNNGLMGNIRQPASKDQRWEVVPKQRPPVRAECGKHIPHVDLYVHQAAIAANGSFSPETSCSAPTHERVSRSKYDWPDFT